MTDIQSGTLFFRLVHGHEVPNFLKYDKKIWRSVDGKTEGRHGDEDVNII